MLVIRKVERVPNTSVRKLWKVKKGVNEKNDESFLWWFGSVERMNNIKKGNYPK